MTKIQLRFFTHNGEEVDAFIAYGSGQSIMIPALPKQIAAGDIRMVPSAWVEITIVEEDAADRAEGPDVPGIMRRALAWPEGVLGEGPQGGEGTPSWQARAVLAAMEDAGLAIVPRETEGTGK